MERVLITGGSGFLGHHLTSQLRNSGFQAHAPSHQEMDLLNLESVEVALAKIKPDIVIHAAAVYGGIGLCSSEPQRLYDVNAQMHENLFAALAKTPPRRVVGIGSSCAYPGDRTTTLIEKDYEQGALHPSVAGYAATKRLLLEKLRSSQIPFQFPILSNLYGPHDSFDPKRSHVVAALIRRFVHAERNNLQEVMCWGTGRPERECLFVRDAADGIVRLIQDGIPGPTNLGTGDGITIAKIAQTIAKIAGYKGEVRWNPEQPDGALRKVLNIERLKAALGWQPQTSLKIGRRETMAWYKGNCAHEEQ